MKKLFLIIGAPGSGKTTDAELIAKEDGYPRSMEQLNALDEYLKTDVSLELCSVIEVEVSQSTARDRVLGRSRGEDDKVEIFNNRMRVYTQPLADIQAFYKSKNLLHIISGEGSVEEIVSKMQNFIDSLVPIKEY